MIGRLPISLSVNGREWNIRTDFRDVLVIMQALGDPELPEMEKGIVMLTVLFCDFREMPPEDYEEAMKRAAWFIDCGRSEEEKSHRKKVMDWEQDEAILFAAVNKVAGKEVRSAEYMHWWTFAGYFMEIEDGTFSTVVGIRQTLAENKKLEKWEKEFRRKNQSLCDLKRKYTPEEKAEIDYLNDLLDGKIEEEV